MPVGEYCAPLGTPTSRPTGSIAVYWARLAGRGVLDMNVGVGIAIGVAMGIVLGVAMGNIGVGIAIGAGMGVAFCGMRAARKNQDRKPPDTPST